MKHWPLVWFTQINMFCYSNLWHTPTRLGEAADEEERCWISTRLKVRSHRIQQWDENTTLPIHSRYNCAARDSEHQLSVQHRKPPTSTITLTHCCVNYQRHPSLQNPVCFRNRVRFAANISWRRDAEPAHLKSRLVHFLRLSAACSKMFLILSIPQWEPLWGGIRVTLQRDAHSCHLSLDTFLWKCTLAESIPSVIIIIVVFLFF